MKKRSLFLSATLGVALALAAGPVTGQPLSLNMEKGEQPRIVTTDGSQLPSFNHFRASANGFGINGNQSTMSLSNALLGDPDQATTFTDANRFWKAAADGKLYGHLTSRKSWVSGMQMHSGIYRIPTSGNGGTYSMISEENQALFGAGGSCYTPHGYFITTVQSFWGITISKDYNIVSLDDWSVTKTYKGDMSFSLNVMAYNEYTDNVNVFYQKGQNELGFGSFDIFTGKLNSICTYPEGTAQWKAMAFGKDGVLYAIDNTSELMKVNPNTGEFTKVGNLGLDLMYVCAATYDRVSDTFYLVSSGMNKGGGLYSIDTTNAKATQIYPFNDEEMIASLYVANELAEDKAPAAVSDMDIVTDNGSLDFNVKFTMPSTTFDGTSASGKITYKIYLDGVEKASGESQSGKAETVKITAPEDGYYSVCVVAYNNDGRGEPVIQKKFIGNDTLLPVTNVKMAYDGNKFDVSWDQPVSTFGGYIDYSKVTYTVTRMPDNVVVADNISETSYTDVYKLPATSKSYYFNVVANYRDNSTAPTASNAETLGFINPPYREPFDIQDDFNAWTTFSKDNHMATWGLHPTEFYICVDTFWAENYNDWIVSPEIKVEAGKTYQISLDVASRKPGDPENIYIWIGDKCDPESRTTLVVKDTNIDHVDFQTITGDYTATKDGTIFVGIQTTDAVIHTTIKADNFYISGPISPDAPDVVTDINIKAADYGKLQATLNFKAPAKTVGGQTLSSLDKIKIFRNGEEITSLTATPGQAISFTDENKDGGIKNGNNTYEFVASNSVGEGRNISTSAYIGYTTPQGTAEVRAVKGDAPNKVDISWDAITKDLNGNLLPLEGLTYSVGRVDLQGNPEIIFTGTDLKYTDALGAEDPQAFYFYGVAASIGEFNGATILSPVQAVGKPYSIPWKESFPDKTLSSIVLSLSDSQHYSWGVYSDADVIGMTSSDDDNGMVIMAADSEVSGVSADLILGYVDLTVAKNPCLLFDFYGYNSKNTIDILINTGDGFKTLETLGIKAGAFWTRHAVELNDYIGKNVQIAFRGTINDNPLIAVDNIRISDVYANDLKAGNIQISREVEPNVDITIAVPYTNEGLNDAKDYTITLFKNGEEAGTVNGKVIEPGETLEAIFKTKFSVVDSEVELKAVIDFADDKDASNNEATAKITVKVPDYPVAGELTALRDNDQNVLAEWADPDLTKAPYEPTVDGAESYPAYSIGLAHSTVSGDNMGEWSVIDVDGAKTIGLTEYDYANEEAPMAWMIFNNVKNGLGDEFPVYEGEQQFVCFANYDRSKTDNWLISPELAGIAQTISFVAQTVVPELGLDQFEILYSTTGKNRDDFKKLGETQTVPADWTSFSFELPEGAKYFAIRGISEGTYAFSVDNIKFVKAGAEKMNLAVIGYNIYRNAKLVNSEAIVENSFLDTDPECLKDSKYQVTVVYDRGESAPSNTVTVEASGVATLGGGVKVFVENGTLVISGAEGQNMKVFSASGLILADRNAASIERIRLEKGVYSLRIGKRSVKVII